MTKELIEIIRQSLIPFVKKELLDINYEGLGKSDAEEFEKDLNEVLDMAIKVLEQQSSGVIGIVSPCKEQTTLAEKLRQLEQPTSDDCVSRADVRKIAKEMYLEVANMDLDVHTISDCISYTSSKCRQVLEDKLQSLPPITPTHGTCKECKYSSVHTISLDKIDEIRVCRIQFSKQIKDDYYCANYEKRGDENEVN